MQGVLQYEFNWKWNIMAFYLLQGMYIHLSWKMFNYLYMGLAMGSN